MSPGKDIEDFSFSTGIHDIQTSLAVDFRNVTTDFYNITAGNGSSNTSSIERTHVPPNTLQIVGVSILVGCISIVTMTGNLLVIIAFKIDKQLQTISNCFLLSLAVADFTIGLVSMPLYTLYLLLDYWPLGPFLCDLWLSIDYTMSSASAANLLLICFDRYYSVTRPLTYRANRTPRKVGIFIGCVWTLSVFLWTPWIFAWPYIEGKRTVPQTDCYIQFLTTNATLTIATAVIAFYIPITIMTILYFKIYRETEKRQKRIPMLQASVKYLKQECKKYRQTDIRRSTYSANGDLSLDDDEYFRELSLRPRDQRSRWPWYCCSKFLDRDYVQNDDDSSSDMPASPVYDDPTQSCCNKTNSRQKTLTETTILSSALRNSAISVSQQTQIFTNSKKTATPDQNENSGDNCDDSNDPLLSDNINYTIVINLPNDINNERLSKPSIRLLYNNDSQDTETLQIDDNGDDEQFSQMDIEVERALNHQDSDDLTNNHETYEHEPLSRTHTESSIPPRCGTPALGRRTKSSNAEKNASEAHIASQVASKMESQRVRRKRQERRQERKAAKTLSAILLAFIITWTPYNIFAVVGTFCQTCIHPTVYSFGTYIISTNYFH